MDRVRAAIRTRHYSPRTEEAYAYWIRRFIVFQGRVHPSTIGCFVRKRRSGSPSS